MDYMNVVFCCYEINKNRFSLACVADTGVPEAVADEPRLSGLSSILRLSYNISSQLESSRGKHVMAHNRYARAQGKSGHVLMAKRTRANRA
ncbi:hypothetical protein SeMB42_g01023 [Synchytrium endobioticum]|uniref:Uncharacterized protein n=1 Tax=Synchytrium endobioticum TaxID=286115 RepID=A0A507DNH2_9FUNG|nr:hypothetical protein SeMB42_g01023 [Synchytrium endobioticum]